MLSLNWQKVQSEGLVEVVKSSERYGPRHKEWAFIFGRGGDFRFLLFFLAFTYNTHYCGMAQITIIHMVLVS